MQRNGLHALADAAATLERMSCRAPPDLRTQREQRRLAVHLRQFEALRLKEARKAAKASAAARVQTRRTRRRAPLVGKMLWKEFNDPHGRSKLYQGEVVSVEWATEDCPFDFGAGVTATVKYSVQYDDGDSEDMTHADVLKHIID